MTVETQLEALRKDIESLKRRQLNIERANKAQRAVIEEQKRRNAALQAQVATLVQRLNRT